MDERDNGSDRYIRGKPKYYGTGQVADMLGEPDSTIRYWTDEFDEFLQIERTGPSSTRRRFIESDIKKLEYIRHLLKDENLSIKQVKEFLSTEDAKNLAPIRNEKEQIMIEALVSVVSMQIDERLNQKFKELEDTLLKVSEIQGDAQRKFKEELDKKLDKAYENMQEELKKDREAIKDLLAEELQANREVEGQRLEELEIKAQEREEKLIEYIKEIRNEKNEGEKKGFWSRFFKK